MSSILVIKGNKALIDLTRGENAQRDKSNSVDQNINSVERALDYINQTYEKQCQKLIDWAGEQEDIHEVIKIAYVFYQLGEVKCRVQKFEPQDEETASILYFYNDIEFLIEGMKDNPHFKTSDNIEDFCNPDW